MKIVKNLSEGNIYKNLLLYSIPLILSSILSQAYSTVDGVIAGKFISAYALGAISASNAVEILFTALIGGIAGGFSIYIAQHFGRGDFATIKRDVIGMTSFVVIIAICFSVLSISFRGPIMNFLNIDPLIRSEAQTYFTIYNIGLVILFANQLFVAVLHALGVTSFSFYVTLLSALMNIGGNLLSVCVFGMGVEGLAISTLISALASSVVYIFMLKKAFREIPSEKTPFKFDFSCVKNSLRYTVPHALQLLSFYGVSFIIAPAINTLGAAATTGYSIANRINALGTVAIGGFASAFGCYTGQCFGRGDIRLIRRGVRVGLWMNCAIELPFVLTVLIFAKPIVSLFFPDQYAGEAYEYAVRYATIFFPFVYLRLIGHFLHTYMRSLGRVSVVLWLTIIGSVVYIIGALTLIPIIGFNGAFISQIISWFVDVIICGGIYFFRYRTENQLKLIIKQ